MVGMIRRCLWRTVRGLSVMSLLAMLLPLCSASARSRPAKDQGPTAGKRWVGSWGASPQPPVSGTLGASGFADQTVRNVVFASVGGTSVRVRLTNTFGQEPLVIGAAAIGRSSAGADVVRGESVRLTFGGHRSITIPPGAQALSDPARLTVRPLSALDVSIFLPQATGSATQHTLAQETNYIAAGDHTGDGAGSAFTTETTSWYFVDEVDVLARPQVEGTVVALGDSLTDGKHSTLDANARWPNFLARRLEARRGPLMGVVDAGIAGNRILNNSELGGVGAWARLGRDVLDVQGVRDLILLEGVNDIGFSQLSGPLTAPQTDVTAAQIIAGDMQIIAQAHAAGIRVFGGTLTPFRDAAAFPGFGYWTPAGEAKREAINHWIMSSCAFDGVINFAQVLADPRDPTMLNPIYDSGDHLHPNDAGYQAMARAVDVADLLRPTPPGCGRPAPPVRHPSGSGRNRPGVSGPPR